MPTGTVWKIGGNATVTWNVRNNHGGGRRKLCSLSCVLSIGCLLIRSASCAAGYSYRLCPASEPMTEACFQQHPLDFDTTAQAILYPDGTRKSIPGTFVVDGTTPPGSMWAMLPIPPAGLGPRCLPGPNDTNSTPFGCQLWEGRDDGHNGHVPGPCVRCPETPGSDCSRCDNGGSDAKSPAFPPPEPRVMGAPQQGILDVVKVPANLAPGDYVLSWRCRYPHGS